MENKINISDEKTYHFARVKAYKPVTEPIVYAEGYGDKSKMIVGFNNMVVFANFENEKHYVITVNEDLNEDVTNIPTRFLEVVDSGELFEVVTLKPTPTTTTAFPTYMERLKDIQRETLPGYDPDKQSLRDYLVQVGTNFSSLAHSTQLEKV